MKHPFFALFLALTLLLPVQARAARDKELVPIADSISNYLRERTTVRSYVSVEKATVLKDGTLRLTLGRGLVDYPLRDQEIKDIQAIASELLPRKYAQYRNKLSLYADKKPIEYYKSRYFSGKAPATGPVKEHRKYAGQYHDKLAAPLVRRMDAAVRPTRGLQNRHIAMWQSHGWYYEQSLKRWEWQRARIFETVEDLYTQSYVVPFLVPMLENAGAVVMLPRNATGTPVRSSWTTMTAAPATSNPDPGMRPSTRASPIPKPRTCTKRILSGWVRPASPRRIRTAAAARPGCPSSPNPGNTRSMYPTRR